jgi:tetrahydromethanopterin S-methyltransferase subunit D
MKKILMISLAASLAVSSIVASAPSAFAQRHRVHHQACVDEGSGIPPILILATVLGAATGGIASGVAYGAAYAAGGTAIGAGGGLAVGLIGDAHHHHC